MAKKDEKKDPKTDEEKEERKEKWKFFFKESAKYVGGFIVGVGTTFITLNILKGGGDASSDAGSESL